MLANCLPVVTLAQLEPAVCESGRVSPLLVTGQWSAGSGRGHLAVETEPSVPGTGAAVSVFLLVPKVASL